MYLKPSLLLLAILSLSACGGGGSDKPKAEANIQLSGAVADGYLVGAKVCLDLNDNNRCDTGEPSTTSTTNGAYSLSNVTATQAKNHSIVAEVTTDTVDEDTGNTVAKPYTISAPAGQHAFVSPITTMVNTLMQQRAVTLEEAKKLTAINIVGHKRADELDPLADFIAKKDSTNPNNIYTQTHKVAQSIATIIGNVTDRLKGVLGSSVTDEQLNLIIILVTTELEAGLSTIASAVLQSSNVATTDTNLSASLLEGTNSTELQTKLDVVKQEQAVAKTTGILTPTEFLALKKTGFRLGGDVSNWKINRFEFDDNAAYDRNDNISEASNSYVTPVPRTDVYKGLTYHVSDGKLVATSKYNGTIIISQFEVADLAGKSLTIASTFNKKDSVSQSKVVEYGAGDKLYSFSLYFKAMSAPTDGQLTYDSICKSSGAYCSNDGNVLGGQSIASYVASLPDDVNKGSKNGYFYWFSSDKNTLHFCQQDATGCLVGTESSVKSYYKFLTGQHNPSFGGYSVISHIDIDNYLYDGRMRLKILFQNDSGEYSEIGNGWYLADYQGQLQMLNESAMRKVVNKL